MSRRGRISSKLTSSELHQINETVLPPGDKRKALYEQKNSNPINPPKKHSKTQIKKSQIYIHRIQLSLKII